MKAEYIDHMGTDLSVVNSARVSFNKESDWEHSHYLSKKDEKLISYLASHNHWTPFSHCTITMREKVPIFVARQRFKHMVGFTYNEVSRRYVDDEPEFYYPSDWRKRPDGSVKQGSSTETIDEIVMQSHCENYKAEPGFQYSAFVESMKMYYNSLINSGVAPEQARMVLPQSMYTEYYVTGSLAAWARAYKLRIDAHAQKEIRDLAKQWGEVIQPLFPTSWEVLVNE